MIKHETENLVSCSQRVSDVDVSGVVFHNLYGPMLMGAAGDPPVIVSKDGNLMSIKMKKLDTLNDDGKM